MDILMVILRLIHLFAGVLWAGTAFFFVRFLEPTINATGAEGQKVAQHLTQRAGLTQVIGLAALLTSLSGIWMYWRIFRGIDVASGYGLGLTIGGLVGLLAALHGFAVQGRAGARLETLGKEIQASGGLPNPVQLTELQSLQARLSNGARLSALLLAISLLGMATAQYLAF